MNETIDDILRSQDYQDAVRQRIIDGTASKMEIELLRRLVKPTETADDAAKLAATRRLTPREQILLDRLLSKMDGSDQTNYSVSLDSEITDADLLPIRPETEPRAETRAWPSV